MSYNRYFIYRMLFIASIFCLMFTAAVFGETPEEKGRQIMEKIDSRPILEKSMSRSTLIIYDAQGKVLFTKKSRTAGYVQDFRDKNKKLGRSITNFFSPADDKGNGALMMEVADDDDNQWLYLKGLRKPKRVVGSDKSSSFMGSDFSNGDLGARDIDDSVYTWLGREKVKYKKKKYTAEKIQNVFKDQQQQKDYGYSKTIVWMHVKTGLPLKMEYHDMNGQLIKKGRLLDFKVKKNRDRKKVFMPSSLEMKNVLRGTRTVMKMKDIKTGSKAKKVRPGIFKVDYLTRKWW